MTNTTLQVITVTLNPAIDQTVTIRDFKAGAVNRVESVRSNPGGKGVNVASALADYGHSVAVTGFLGRENAAAFEELFERKEIADHFVRIAGQTRCGIKISDPGRSETTDINFPGIAPGTDELNVLRNRLAELSSLDHAWIVLAGSIPPGVDPTIYREFTEMFRGRGQKVVLDTSGEPLRHALEAVPHIVKPNIHELEEMLGRTLDSQDRIVGAARELIARGTSLVAVSMGAEGALFVTADEVVTARPPNVQVRSTVGAGDAMVAGIVAGQLRGLPLADCARLATAFSLDALVRGESGITSHAAIEASMQEVTIS
jgi:1-phosphofructokinase